LESPQVTACRELFEETGALLDPNIIESLIRILTHSNQPLPQEASDFSVGWVEYGRYVLYMLPVTQVPQLAAALEGISDLFDDFIRDSTASAPKQIREMKQLVWMDLDDILNELCPAEESDTVVSSEGVAIGDVERGLSGDEIATPLRSSSKDSRFSNFAFHCFRSGAVYRWLRDLCRSAEDSESGAADRTEASCEADCL
jgi:hypothetical protein